MVLLLCFPSTVSRLEDAGCERKLIGISLLHGPCACLLLARGRRSNKSNCFLVPGCSTSQRCLQDSEQKYLTVWLRHFHHPIPCLQDLHTLVLARSNMEAEDIHDLLAWKLPALKTLYLGLAYRFSEQLALDKGYYIAWGLEAVSGSLEKISLGIEYYPSNVGVLDFDGSDELTREDFCGLFKRFPNLWSAEIPITLLLGFFPEDSIDFTDLLPDTIRELCLQWDNAGMRGTSWEFEEQLRGCVRDLLVDCGAHFPCLNRITLRIWDEAKDQYGDNERAELKNMCADAKNRFGYHI